MAETLEEYNKWVLANPQQAKRIEDVARTLSYLLPTNYSDDGLGTSFVSEAVYSLVNLVGLYNDHLVLSKTRSKPGERLSARKRRVRHIQWSLTALSAVDVVLEMGAKVSGGNRRRWQMITFVESVRAALKLTLLYYTQDRHLLNGGVLDVPVPPPQQPDQTSGAGSGSGGGAGAGAGAAAQWEAEEAAARVSTRWWRGKRSGARVPLPADFPTTATYEGDLEAASRPARLVGEVTHICRPLVYLAARRVFGGKSWMPLFASAAMDLASWRATEEAETVASGGSSSFSSSSCSSSSSAAAADSGDADLMTIAEKLPGAAFWKFLLWLWTSNHPTLSPAERAEMARRKRLLGYYLLRGPLFQSVLKPGLDGVVKITSFIPLLGVLLAYARDMLCFFQRHYFFTSASR